MPFDRRKFIALAAAATAMLGGCSAMTDENSTNEGNSIAPAISATPTSTTMGNGASDAISGTASIAQYPVGDDAAGMDALFTGTVNIQTGCVYVTDGSVRKLPVFPQGSIAWNAAQRAFTYQGGTYAAGDTISLGGGEGRGGAELPASFFSTPPADGCDTSAMWIVSP